MRDHIFISYSHADRVWLERLNTFLKPLKRAQKIVVWDDTAIQHTDVWHAEIQHGLDHACIAILLVSANFFASDFIHEVELPTLLQAAADAGVKILPIIVGTSRFEREPQLYQFQAANNPRRPLNSLPPHEADTILQNVANTCEDVFGTATASLGSVEADVGMPGNRTRLAPAATRAPVVQPDMSRPITLLHVSDTQFGRNHRFGSLALPPDDTFDTLLARLGDDLQCLEQKYGLRPDLLVLSGDLAAEGLPREFNDVLQFVEGLTQLITLPRHRVVIIPGNHDINPKACAAYFSECEADEEKPVAPFWPKWRHYAQFFHRFYRDCPDITFTETAPWTLFAMPDLKLVVAGLNSTIRESHRAEDHYGYLGEPQLRWFADKLATYRNRRAGWSVIHSMCPSFTYPNACAIRSARRYSTPKMP